MQDILNEIVAHTSHSHQQLARILDAKKQVTVRLAHIVGTLPDATPELNGLSGLIGGSMQLNKSVVSYLNSLADLQDAMAESLSNVIGTFQGGDEE